MDSLFFLPLWKKFKYLYWRRVKITNIKFSYSYQKACKSPIWFFGECLVKKKVTWIPITLRQTSILWIRSHFFSLSIYPSEPQPFCARHYATHSLQYLLWMKALVSKAHSDTHLQKTKTGMTKCTNTSSSKAGNRKKKKKENPDLKEVAGGFEAVIWLRFML